jgi:hypothetical protein
MPTYDVADRHKIYVAAPPVVTMSAAGDVDLSDCLIARAIFKSRDWILRSKPDHTVRPHGLLAQVKSLGWVVLAELPGREFVFGAVAKPWEANPVFRSLPSEEFARFEEPGYVKIVWTLRADPIGHDQCIFRTETRAVATDSESRRKFRRYWAFLSPGIIVIRKVMLPAVKTGAERRWKRPAA